METRGGFIRIRQPGRGPTRWGNQLNGNAPVILRKDRNSLIGPTRWGNQLNGNTVPASRAWRWHRLQGPTRWGNQLNGNPNEGEPYGLPNVGPTRWGNQLNGNSFLLTEE